MSRPRIRVLADTAIDQIAAGEVLERPSSAVKELVENSLDAGATRIDIALVEGGTREIRVTDDGFGMSAEDLENCVLRHATSKIRSVDDLLTLNSFGFRGEALSSIASVADFTIRSCLRGEEGSEIQVRFGEKSAARPSACPPGTSVHARDLFDRIPARRKFLRSAATEFSHCARVVREIALGNPQTRFSLIHQDRRVAEYVAPGPIERFQECLRAPWRPLEISEECEGMHLSAFLSPPNWAADRGELWIYVNRRPVRQRSITSAIRQAYASSLGAHHEPSGAIFLEIRSDWIDPNAHPQKLEVRLQKEQSVYSWLNTLVRKHLTQRPEGRPTVASERKPPEIPTFVVPEIVRWSNDRPTLNTPAQSYRRDSRSAPQPSVPTAPPTAPSAAPATEIETFRYLGQVNSEFLICEDAHGVLFVDPRALAEKHHYEELSRRWEAGELRPQPLMVPKIVPVAAALADTAEGEQDFLSSFGLEIDRFGKQELVIRAVPDILPDSEIPDFIAEVLICLRDRPETAECPKSERVASVFASLARYSVGPGSRDLSLGQVQKLLSLYSRIGPDWRSPHGRPVSFRMDFGQIRKHFERT